MCRCQNTLPDACKDLADGIAKMGDAIHEESKGAPFYSAQPRNVPLFLTHLQDVDSFTRRFTG